MLRVLQHYLPIRTALLVLSEALLLWLVFGSGMSQHLWEAMSGRKDADFALVLRQLARLNLTPNDAFWRCVASALFVTLLCQVSIGFNRLYEFEISSSRYERAARFVESAGTALALSVGMTLLANFWGFERMLDFPGLALSQRMQTLVASLVTGFGLLYLWRNVYHWCIRRLDLQQRVLVLGSRGPAHSLAREILTHPDAGFEMAGLIPELRSDGQMATPAAESADERDPSSDQAPDGAAEASTGGNGSTPAATSNGSRPKLITAGNEATEATEALVLESVALRAGEVQNRGVAMSTKSDEGGSSLLQLVRQLRVDVLTVALEDRRSTLPTEDLLRCRLAGIEVREREELYEQITGKLAVEAMRPSYLIFNEGFRRHPWAALLKRIADVLFALVILALTWPVMLITAIFIPLNSKGPVLFRQERVGQDGRSITLMKFRSMRADAEKETGPVWSSEDDPRITRIGKFIRKTRIDELPQLFNVLGGSMSLVGPRPERQYFVDELAEQIPYYHQRHIVKPGLTGWAQINYPYGNTAVDALHKLQYDLFYIKNQSLLFDLSILFNTIKTVVLRQGT